jgi:hypothetical protein
MGARAAVMAAAEAQRGSGAHGCIASLILVSYPLQSPKGDLRDRILLEVPAEVEVLFISGDGDAMCDLGALKEVRRKMVARSWMVVVRGAGHGMDVKPKRGTEAVGVETGRLAAEWLAGRREAGTECEIWWDGEKGTARRSAWRRDAEVATTTAGKDGDAGDGAEGPSVPDTQAEKGGAGHNARRPSITSRTKRRLTGSEDDLPDLQGSHKDDAVARPGKVRKDVEKAVPGKKTQRLSSSSTTKGPKTQGVNGAAAPQARSARSAGQRKQSKAGDAAPQAEAARRPSKRLKKAA